MTADQQPDNVIAFSGNTMVYESVKRFALKGLTDLIRVLMENIDDALFDLSEKVESDQERNMYFDAMRQIRLKRQGIQQEFDQQMQQHFDELLLNNKNDSQNSLEDELSLVGQDEIEDQLAIDNMISKARPHFEDDLFAVSERLKVILHRDRVDEDSNPLDPKAICESFHNACNDLDSDIHVRLIFYKMFDKFVVSSLGGFYRELNEYFIQKGVLPEFQASQERLKHTTRFMANRISRAQQEESKEPQVEASADQTKTGQPTAANASTPAVDGNVLSLLQQALFPTGSPQAASPPTGANGAPPGQQISGVTPAQGGDGALPTQGSAVVIYPEYAAALTGLQGASRGSQPSHTVNPKEFKTELQQQLITFREEHSHLTSSADNQIIDIVSMLFDFFFDDEALPDPVKVLIGRLQIPILKVAMLDDSFFNQKKHPARKLLDSISKASLGWSDDQRQEQRLIDKLELIVDFLLTEFEQDVSVFKTALNDFQAFIQQENEKVSARLEQVRDREKENEKQVQLARQTATDFIHKMLRKHELGFEVIEFLEGIWLKVLSDTLTAEGKDSNHWKNLKRITTTLVWTLIPKHSEEDKSKLIKTLPSLLRALSRGMELIKTDSDEQNQVFKMLVLQHSKVVKQTSKNLVTRVDDKTVWPESGMEAALAGFNQSQDNEEEAVDIQFSQDDTGEIQVVENQLDESYQSESITNVSATPTVEVVQELDEFTQCVNQGDLNIDEEIILESHDVQFDRAHDRARDDFDTSAGSLDIGDWVEFIESDHKSINAKLSWKSNVTGKYVFVNRHGLKIKNMTVNGLAMELRAGRAKIIDQVSVFDRAINSFMTGLKQN